MITPYDESSLIAYADQYRELHEAVNGEIYNPSHRLVLWNGTYLDLFGEVWWKPQDDGTETYFEENSTHITFAPGMVIEDILWPEHAQGDTHVYAS